MKRSSLFLIKSVLALFAFVVFFSCDDPVEPIPYFPMAKVSKVERDSVMTLLSYKNKELSGFSIYINDVFTGNAYVNYKSGSISCTMNNVRYDIELSNTKGGVRAASVRASMNGNTYYIIHYVRFDEQGRLTTAQVDGVDGQSRYTNYYYEGNTVFVEEGGHRFPIELSSFDNVGYVCNVLDFANAPLTSKYVINPDLYFLNIYGTPVSKLPQGQEIEYTANNELRQVGKYFYEY